MRAIGSQKPLPFDNHASLQNIDQSKLVPSGRDLRVLPHRAVHAVPRTPSHPVVLLTIDMPRRAPDDIVLVNSDDGLLSSFIAGI